MEKIKDTVNKLRQATNKGLDPAQGSGGPGRRSHRNAKIRRHGNTKAEQGSFAGQAMLVRCAALNRLTHLGMPASYNVA